MFARVQRQSEGMQQTIKAGQKNQRLLTSSANAPRPGPPGPYVPRSTEVCTCTVDVKEESREFSLRVQIQRRTD